METFEISGVALDDVVWDFREPAEADGLREDDLLPENSDECACGHFVDEHETSSCTVGWQGGVIGCGCFGFAYAKFLAA